MWASCVNINNQSQSRAPEEKTEPTKSRFLNLLLSSVLTVKAEMCIHLSKVAIHFQRWKHKWREPWDRQISCRKVEFENANRVHDAAIKTPFFFVHFVFVQNNEALPLAIQNFHFLILIFWIICLSFSFLFLQFLLIFCLFCFFHLSTTFFGLHCLFISLSYITGRSCYELHQWCIWWMDNLWQIKLQMWWKLTWRF